MTYDMPFDELERWRVGRIIKVGTHWDRPDLGRSGWHALVEYAYLLAKTRG